MAPKNHPKLLAAKMPPTVRPRPGLPSVRRAVGRGITEAVNSWARQATTKNVSASIVTK